MPRRSTETSAPRQAGAHYTPDALAESFTEEALRVWESSWGGLGGHELWERETRIVDPACGDGALLLSVAAGMWRRLADTPKHRVLRTSDEALIARSVSRLRGVELRADAAVSAKAALPGADIVCGDGLAEVPDGALIVMNPPWVGRSKRDADTTARIKEITSSGACDLACAFLRAYPTARQISAILPKACTEGENRRVGLGALVANGWRILSATTAAKWPGDAKVMYVSVHLQR